MRPFPPRSRRAVRRIACAAVAAAATGLALAQEEVPFIVSPDPVTLAMLELAGTGPADRVVDLGSGDGRIVITAARRFGASGLGVEIVPDLVAKSRAAARDAGVESKVEFRVQDLFRTELGQATVVTMYLLPEVNMQLRPRLLALTPGTRIVSHDWHLGDWQPDRTLTIDVPDKPVGRERLSRVHLWVVPTRVEGIWCAGATRLVLMQRFQRFSAERSSPGDPGPAKVFDGRVEGHELHPEAASGVSPLRASADGAQLREAAALGGQGRVFTRSRDGRCAAA